MSIAQDGWGILNKLPQVERVAIRAAYKQQQRGCEELKRLGQKSANARAEFEQRRQLLEMG
jgi:hypothetical protein